MKPKLIIALQYWSGDYKETMRLAAFISTIEAAPRDDVEIELVPRFDAPEPSKDVVKLLQQKFVVRTYRTKRRGQGHPAGCNDMVHDLFGEYWRRFAQERGWAGKYHGVWLLEGDNVPLRADWIDVMLGEWALARAEGKLVCGCRMPGPLEHINGNLIFAPDLFNKVSGLTGCPSYAAWDMFHAAKLLPLAFGTKKFINFYRATNVPHSRIYGKGGKARYALVHGVKDDSVYDAAKRKLLNLPPKTKTE